MTNPYPDVPGAYSLTIAGQEMWFKPPSHGQIVLYERLRMQMVNLSRMEDDAQAARAAITMIAKSLNLIDALFLNPEDQDYVLSLITQDKIGISELAPILAGGKETVASDDDAEPAVKPAKRAKR